MTTLDILALDSIQGYGPVAVRKIMELAQNQNIGTAEGLLELVNTYEATRKKPSFKTIEDIKKALLSAGDLLLQSESQGIKVVSYLDENFPQKLCSVRNTRCGADVPLVIFFKGDLSLIGNKSIAIIGTREPSPKAWELSFHYGKLFSHSGFNIISGLTKGCDSQALEGTFSEAGGKAIALLDHGLDIIESDEEAKLAEEIVSHGGLILTRYPMGKKATRCTFSVTNRIQAALEDATLVIQSRTKDSSLHTAMAALKADKPVFCVDLKELEENSDNLGNALLLYEGAYFLEKRHPLQQVNDVIRKHS